MKILFMNDIGVNLDSANLMSFYMLKDYYEYEVWDLSPIFGVTGTIKNIDEAITINSIDIFKRRLIDCRKCEEIVIITNMVERPWKKLQAIAQSLKIPVICTQKNNFFDILKAELATDFSISIPAKKRLGYLILKFSLTRKIYNYLTHRNAKYDYLISAYNSKPETVKNFVRAHNVKYDEYLQNINSNNIVGEKYILFIDSSLCYHPIDFKKEDPLFNSDHYIQQLNRYFEKLEKKYNLPVVIALHPVSVERLNESDFDGRKLIYGKTTQLIHHAEFVVSHYSTSLINAVLAKKPVIIVSSREIEGSLRGRQQSWANAFAKMCGFNKDSLDIPVLPKATVDLIKYESFIEKYLINSECPDTSNAMILLNLLHELENRKTVG